MSDRWEQIHWRWWRLRFEAGLYFKPHVYTWFRLSYRRKPFWCMVLINYGWLHLYTGYIAPLPWDKFKCDARGVWYWGMIGTDFHRWEHRGKT